MEILKQKIQEAVNLFKSGNLAKSEKITLKLIEANLPIYFFCGLIAIITESFLWDAYDSAFFWIIIAYALAFSEDRSIPEEGSRAIT